MNEHKKMLPCKSDLGEMKEEEYEVIKEDYNSSPKCGIRERVAHKLTRNVSFSPLEISTYPYFKYCVTQIKEEQKINISQTEINQKNNNLKHNSNKSELKLSLNDKEKNNKNDSSFDMDDNKDEKDTEETNYIQLVEKKSSEITINTALKLNEINKQIKNDKVEQRNAKSFLKCNNEYKKNIHYSQKCKDKNIILMKLKLKNEEEQIKNNQKNIYNMLNNIDNRDKIHSNKMNTSKILQTEENNNTNINKSKPVFNAFSFNFKNITEKKFSKEKKKEFKVRTSFTTNNIKGIKKTKKIPDNDNNSKKLKLRNKVTRQHSFIPLNKVKKDKIHIEEKNKNNSKKRPSLIQNDESKKQNKIIFFNILNNDEVVNKNKLKKKILGIKK
jgi:hypothetical protein